MADDKKTTKVKGFKLSKFKTDDKLEEEGVWVPYGSGCEFLIARIGNRRFKEFMMKNGKPHMRRVTSGTLDSESADELMKEAIAETVLLGWKNLIGEDGKPIEYSKEACREALEIEDFYKEIMALAQERELYRTEDRIAAEGN